MIFSFWNKLQKSLFCQTELESASALHCCRQLLCNWQGTDWFCKFLKKPFQSALCPHANLSDRLLTDVVRLGRQKLILPNGFVVSKSSYRNEDAILPFNLSAVAQRHVFDSVCMIQAFRQVQPESCLHFFSCGWVHQGWLPIRLQVPTYFMHGVVTNLAPWENSSVKNITKS